MENPMSKQVGGNHYTRCSIQPWEIIERNGLGFFEGNVIKYVMRYQNKNGLQDLLKAKHYIEYLINREEKNVQTITQEREFPKVDESSLPKLQPSTDSNSPLPANCPWGVASITTPFYAGSFNDGN